MSPLEHKAFLLLQPQDAVLNRVLHNKPDHLDGLVTCPYFSSHKQDDCSQTKSTHTRFPILPTARIASPSSLRVLEYACSYLELAQAMDAIHGLELRSRVPPRVHDKYG